jgi:ABC-type oligopeptide transport system substrate-binding subunit
MFENGELDVMSIDSATYEAALDPSHPFNPLLYISRYGGLAFVKMKIDTEPLEDLLVRKGLAHGVDMEATTKAVWGPWRRMHEA